MDKGDYVTISLDNVLPAGEPWKSQQELLQVNYAVGIIRDIEHRCSTTNVKVEFLIDGEPDYFWFRREELEYAPIYLLTLVQNSIYLDERSNGR